MGVGFVEFVLYGGALLVSGPGSRFLRAAPRGILAAARRGEVPLACCSGWCFQRFTPRGVLRWCGARGALRPLFLLRSCAADQEKRPEKKSGAVIACASLRLERLRDTCIRSAPRCISRGQREEGVFWLCGKEIWGRIVGAWVCGVCAVRWGFGGLLPRKLLPSRCAARVLAAARRGGVLLASCSGGCFLRAAPRGGLAAARRDRALLVSGPEAASFALRRAGGCVDAGPRGAAAAFLASLMRR